MFFLFIYKLVMNKICWLKIIILCNVKLQETMRNSQNAPICWIERSTQNYATPLNNPKSVPKNLVSNEFSNPS